MAIFSVILPAPGRYTRIGAKQGLILVSAENSASAIEIARAKFNGDTEAWSEASVGTITTATVGTAGAMLDWVLKIRVSGPDMDSVFEVKGGASETLDSLCTLMATALNAHALIAGAVYTAASNTLTVAAIADNLGDHTVVVELYPDVTENNQLVSGKINQAALIGTITHQGAVAAALTVVFVADTVISPRTHLIY